jgi:hypothetical protein
MGQRERIALWVLVGLGLLAQLITLPLLFGEVAELRRQLNIVAGVPGAAPTPAWNANTAPLPTTAPNVGQASTWGAQLQVRVTQVAVSEDGESATLTLAVRGSGAADPLLDLPALVCGEVVYPVDGASLETARMDLLALITRGEATAELVFYGHPDLSLSCALVLNPQQAADSVVAPRIEAPVPQLAPVATPTEEEP